MRQWCNNTYVAYWNLVTYHSNNPGQQGSSSHTTAHGVLFNNGASAYYSIAVKLTDAKVTTLLTL